MYINIYVLGLITSIVYVYNTARLPGYIVI